MLVVPRSNSTADWLHSCLLQEKHQITPRDRADRKYCIVQEPVLKSTYRYCYRYFLTDTQPVIAAALPIIPSHHYYILVLQT